MPLHRVMQPTAGERYIYDGKVSAQTVSAVVQNAKESAQKCAPPQFNTHYSQLQALGMARCTNGCNVAYGKSYADYNDHSKSNCNVDPNGLCKFETCLLKCDDKFMTK